VRDAFKKARATDEKLQRVGNWCVLIGIGLNFLGLALLPKLSGRAGEVLIFVALVLLFGGIFVPGAIVWVRERRRGDVGDVRIPPSPAISFADATRARRSVNVGDEKMPAPPATNFADRPRSPSSGPQRPLLYMFQHVALREAAFSNHPRLTRELVKERQQPFDLLHFWAKALIRCEDAGMRTAANEAVSLNSDETEALRRAVKIHTRSRHGYTVYFIEMPKPLFMPEAYFTAIVHKDDELHEYGRPSPSTRYFTLERNDPSSSALFCEWHRPGKHVNSGQLVPPELDAFAKAVFDRLPDGGRDTASTPTVE
jgi:hypothetical protein